MSVQGGRVKRIVLFPTEPSTIGTERIEAAVTKATKPKLLTNAELAAIAARNEVAKACRANECSQWPCVGDDGGCIDHGARIEAATDIDALLAEVKLLRSRPITDPHYNVIYDPED